MTYWKLPNDSWTAVEKGVHGHTIYPQGGSINTTFPPTYDNKRNRLKLAFMEQYNMGWDSLIEGRMGSQ
jgi:hypothetical protein